MTSPSKGRKDYGTHRGMGDCYASGGRVSSQVVESAAKETGGPNPLSSNTAKNPMATAAKSKGSAD